MASSGVIQNYGVILGRRPTSSSSSSSVTGKIGRGQRTAGKRQRDRVAAARARRTQVSGKITGRGEAHQKLKSSRTPAAPREAKSVAECLWSTGTLGRENTPPAQAFGKRSTGSRRCGGSRSSSEGSSKDTAPLACSRGRGDNARPSSSSTSTSMDPSRVKRLFEGGWGQTHRTSSSRGFPNIKVRCLRTGARRRLADVCRGKVCVVDFWMTKHGRSPIVSMDA